VSSTKIQKKKYAYCPNPVCCFLSRKGTLDPKGSKHYVLELKDGNKDKVVCPNCGEGLKRACPNCGRVFYEKPQQFCPACGQNLFQSKKEKICEICGRLIYRSILEQETVFVCSEACLSIFIQRHVKICDQCGLRFRVEPGMNGRFVNLELTIDDSRELDFCSEKCLKDYQTRLRSSDPDD